jgi:hypothetical protein
MFLKCFFFVIYKNVSYGIGLLRERFVCHPVKSYEFDINLPFNSMVFSCQ